MLPKLKITTYVFILCLFGLTLITVSPVFASSPEFTECQKTKGKEKKKNCFKNLALALIEASQDSTSAAVTGGTPNTIENMKQMASDFCKLQRCCDGKIGIPTYSHAAVYSQCLAAYKSGWAGIGYE